MKKSSDPEPKKKSLIGRLKTGIKRLLGGENSASVRGAEGRHERTKKDLFPDEGRGRHSRGENREGATERQPHREARERSGSERSRPPRGEGRRESASGSSGTAGGERHRPARVERRGGSVSGSERPRAASGRSSSAPPRPEGGPPPREQGTRPPRAEGEGSSSERGGRSGRGGAGERGGRGGRGDRREGPPRAPKEPRVQFPPASPPPPPPPEPEGPFPEAFAALGLPPRLLAAIREMDYVTTTTIQEKAIPLILGGRDLIGASQTGTGKTAAFGLPILTKLGAPDSIARCLVLEPTRELALQVVDHFERFNVHTGLRSLAIYGGVGYEKQRRGLHEGVDVLVATPGRLLDFMGDGTIKLDRLQFLVLDEVDRMLDMGFLPDVRRIVDECPRQRQTLFFSATMPPQIKTLADWALKEPVEVEVGIRFSAAETVSHYFYPVATDQREQLLKALLDQTHWESVMIFTRTKMQADRLYSSLTQLTEHKVAVMHSDIPQRDREKALAGFRDGSFEVIVATDLAARGLDVSGVTHVINYQVPEHAEDYVHRIGRTGRAQKEGDAFTLISAEELPYAEAIERLIGQTIERRKLEGFPYEYTTLLDPHAGNADKFKKMFRSGKPTGKKRR